MDTCWVIFGINSLENINFGRGGLGGWLSRGGSTWEGVFGVRLRLVS